MHNITPVILAGGSGKRLWPLSRKSYPKQFTEVFDKISLFQRCVLRLCASSLVNFEKPITLTNSDFRFIVCEQFNEVGVDPGPILIEPESKNTAAAILAASVFACDKDKNAILVVAPSDHLIPETSRFHEVIKAGLSHVNDGKMVTFGIRPTAPETGYGYLQTSSHAIDEVGSAEILSFVEKPMLEQAKLMVNSGDYLWNAGIFMFRASDMIDAFKVYAPNTLNLVRQSVFEGNFDLGFLRLSETPWQQLENISIDYAIMEKAQNLIAVPYTSKWSDLGDWEAVWSESQHDDLGNVTSGNAHTIVCKDSLLRTENSSQHVVGIGLNNVIVVAMHDAVLVADKERAQDVKKAVDLLKEKNIPQSEAFPIDHRPWGWFERLTMGDRFQVKRICVKPGGLLSLQSHKYRSEHWVVVQGTAKITIEDEVKIVGEGQSVYVEQGAKHRMENIGELPMVLIEVQIGTYLGEDDIVRYEDVYQRN